MRRARLRIGLLSGILAVSMIIYGLFFGKLGMLIPEWIYNVLIIYVLGVLWYLYRQLRSKGDANTKG